MSDSEKPVDITEPENELPDISQYEGHFALAGKGKGCSVSLKGNVCLVGFLINDRSSAWTKEDEEQMKEVLQNAAFMLKEKSGLTDNRLKVTCAFDSVVIQYKYEKENFHNVVKDVLKQYGFDNAAAYQAHYKKKFKKAEAPIIFFVNRSFRSFALRDDSDKANRNTNEYSFVSVTENKDNCIRSLIHEIMHQFGAIDYYLPERVKEAAEQFFPDSIMNNGLEIDDLTRYVIGWDEKPTEAVFKFLDATADVTEEEIREAREKDSDNDW